MPSDVGRPLNGLSENQCFLVKVRDGGLHHSAVKAACEQKKYFYMRKEAVVSYRNWATVAFNTAITVEL